MDRFLSVRHFISCSSHPFSANHRIHVSSMDVTQIIHIDFSADYP